MPSALPETGAPKTKAAHRRPGNGLGIPLLGSLESGVGMGMGTAPLDKHLSMYGTVLLLFAPWCVCQHMLVNPWALAWTKMAGVGLRG